MSSSTSTPGQTYTPNFKSILDAALSEYKKKTGKQLFNHPLATELQRCDSVDAILAIFQGQAEAFQQFRDGDQRLMRWISPVVDVLYTFSETLGGVANIPFPPAGAIIAGIGVLLAAAKGVSSSHDALVEFFERIESFFKRLGVYTQISLTTEMAEVFVKIVAEVLSILAIATKEVRRKRAKIYFRRLLGRTDVEDALRRLDGLIQEEVRMAIAQIMKAAGNQMELDVRKWLSPPDPSTNHNTACDVYHNVPPIWFFEASVFMDWMSSGSLLWIHGKPGSGKSILCSAIIQHIMTLRDAGKATLAYFYFDFRDDEKQNVRDVVTSVLVQLSAYSRPCCDIVYRLYLAHGKGAQQPSNGILIDCLQEMLTAPAQYPIFIVMDALDECPDYGMPTPREAVLNFVMDLVRLQLPNLHICATSRPEVDIQSKLKPLAINAISLHDETRQRIVIANYVSSVVSSDQRMRKWGDEDKRLVVEELSERADGMFQWVFCQLEMLRHAVQPDVRAILEKLPRTLDETYERVLKDINENNREHARRLLHCLAVSVRPLRVEELAEILAFDFDTARGGIPKFHTNWRPKDQEEAVLSICSSLITVVNNRGSRVVQFSHLSVKEFLTSDHLASATGHLTAYHILPRPAHTILAQVCLGFLLHLDGRNDDNGVESSPLAEYAAQHWIAHAQFEDVASRVENGMKPLFDLDRPHFAAWIGLYDIDAEPGRELPSEIPSPLYYSALLGFSDLTRHIAIKYPQHVNAVGGLYEFPLVAALSRNHFRVAELLLEHGGNVDVRDKKKQTALHKTIDRHDKLAINMVQFLLEHGADVNAQRDDLWTPLHLAANIGGLILTRMLLERQADVNLRNDDGQAPLHILSRRGASHNEDDDPGIAKSLLERGANVNEKDKDNATPLHLAIYNKRPRIVRVLLDYGANTDVEKDQGEKPLQIVLRGNHNAQEDGVGVARLLLEHGAEAYARDKYHVSTSDLACCFGKEKIRQVLLGDGGKFKPETNRDQTAFWLWIEDCGVDGNVQDKYETILLHSASYHGKPGMVQILLNRGVKSNAKNHLGKTALHVVSRGKHDPQDGVRVAQLLLESGVDVDAQDMDHDTPLHSASYNGRFEIARVLLDHDAKASAKNDRGETPLHQVSIGEYESQVNGIGIARLLLDRDVDVNAQDMKHVTPLHLASWCGKLEIAQLLLGHATLKNDRVRTLLHVGPKERTVDLNVQTPLHFACFRGHPEIARLLLDHGAKVNAKNDQGETPLHLVSRGEYDSPNDGACVIELLLERGTDAITQDKSDQTSPHAASYDRRLEITRVLVDHRGTAKAEHEQGRNTHQVSQRNFESQEAGVRIVELLLEHGGDPNVQNKNQETPLHVASRCGKLEIVRALLGHASVKNARSQTPWRLGLRGSGADVNALAKDNWTPLHSACSWGRLEIARLLLDHGAKANAETDYGETPLHTATNGKYEPQEDGVRIAQLLLERGVDANAQRKDNYTPLHAASYYGRLDIVRLLLVHGAKADTVDNFGYTPLHFVSCGKSKPQDGVQVARLLLECGGDVNGRNKRQQTPLHVASYNGRLEIARLLLDHGGNVNAVDDLGDTPLHNVSQGKYDSEETGIGLARLLLERGGDVNGRSNEQRTPLHVASYNGKVEIAQLLLGHGAKVRAVDDLGETPLHDVSQGKYDSEEAGVNITRLLLERDGDVNGQSKKQQTPLHAASKNGKLEIARLLLDHGAKVGAADDLGDTPLHNVLQGKSGSEEAGVGLAKLLLERGGDVNEQSKEQRTPLHSASYNGRLEIARLLLGHGAKVDAVDDLGRTPLHYVSFGTYDSEEAGIGLVRLLLEHGGDVNGQTKNQGTPLHFASYNGRLEIVQLLLDHGAEVDAADDWGETPLHDVSKGEYDYEEAGVDVARVLLKHGADANIKSRSGKTPLDLVSGRRRLKLAQLLEHRVVVNAQSERRGQARVKR